MSNADAPDSHSIDFLTHFSTLSDPRQQTKLLYPMAEVLLLTLCAVLSGANDWVAISAFGTKKLAFLRKFLPFSDGTPSHDQLGNIYAALDANHFQACFMEWVASLNSTLSGVVAIDGKTSRRSLDKAGGKAAIHMISAWSSELNLTLAQRQVDGKSNEITAIPELLDLLTIKGAIVTIDAMGCQRDIADKIITKQADYVLALKGNQGALRKDTELFMKEQDAVDFANTTVIPRALNFDTGGFPTRLFYDSLVAKENFLWLRRLNYVLIIMPPGFARLCCGVRIPVKSADFWPSRVSMTG